jgi:hypothetical protein
MRFLRRLVAPVSTLVVLACGGGDLVLPNGGGDGGGTSSPSAGRSTISADPASIEAVTGSSTITVVVRDGNGDPVQGAAVELSATGSDNTLTQPSGTTGSDGMVTGSLRSAVAGTKVVSAMVNGSVRVSQTAQVTFTPAPQARVELIEGDNQSAPAGTRVPIRPAVRVTNDAGLPEAGFTVTFVVTAGGGSVDAGTQTTNTEGIARVDGWLLGSTPATNTLEARAGSLPGSPVVFTAEGTSGGAASVDHFVFMVQPHDVEKDEPMTVQVALVDATGGVVPLSGIVIYLGLFREGKDEPSNKRLDGERFRPTQNGIAVFSDLRVTEDGSGYRFRALSDGLPTIGPTFSSPFDVD